MIFLAKVSNKSEKASNVLLSNVRLNRKTGNRQKRAGRTNHDEKENETDVGDGERRTTKREKKRTERKCWATGSRRDGKWTVRTEALSQQRVAKRKDGKERAGDD